MPGTRPASIRPPRSARRPRSGSRVCSLPSRTGGQDLDGLTGSLILEQLARGCFATTFGLVVHNNFARSLARAGTPAARARWLATVTRGERLGGFALTEPEACTDEANGDLRIDDFLSPLPPAVCASPVLLIRNAGNGAWFAAGIPKGD